jgi:hypothetical protein
MHTQPPGGILIKPQLSHRAAQEAVGVADTSTPERGVLVSPAREFWR